ncbi:MAG: xanthan lyase [Prevotellaceae bacterium]|nr:xanthan lyase [Prevotellaceae bacterium]
MKQRYYIIALLLSCFLCQAHAQNVEKALKEWAKNYARKDCNIVPSTLVSYTVDNKTETVRIVMGGGFQEQYFLPQNVEDIYSQVRDLLPNQMRKYDVVIETDGRPIEELVPNFFRKGKKDSGRLLKDEYKGEQWVKNISRPYTASDGLEGNHIALWQSHGRYYQSDKREWVWQRPRLFCTTEDLLSQTFVVPYIIPMLQNAGAVVFTPRERDYQSCEVIVDNDQPHKDGTYAETFRTKQKNGNWMTSPQKGFAHLKEIYETIDSPFVAGTSRYCPTVSSLKDEEIAQWTPDIPKEGRYAVYVTYRTHENAVTDATYTVHHKGGATEFKVNQQIGGGIWLYLGTFEFDEGQHDYGMVTLSNHSQQKGVVSADAVRFGGGMGNIVPVSATQHIRPSGMPRWAEAAKYSVQWMGFPYSIHTEPFGINDYNNDINSRSAAVNYLLGGSIYDPEHAEGLKVPLDLSVAFHTDAGIMTDDQYVGPLSIYTTNFNDGKTGAGLDRYVSRDLASMFLTNLYTDLRKYDWQVRQLWNRNYGETRVPLTPACILEMLSHQNFADMKRAYDPKFRFDFSRSVYKTLVKYVATLYRRSYTIQPLPVDNFAISLNEANGTATLTWSSVNDPIEPSATPQKYIVYTRHGDGGFDNGTVVQGTAYTVPLNQDQVYSFRVTALNQGGESFPSEVLSCGISSQNKGTVLIVNAFTRLEGPAIIDTPTECGFDLDADPGVPYGAYTGFCGRQLIFDRSKAEGEAVGEFASSGSELEGQIVMGNTFDYVAIHGHAAMLSRRHSFTSCSENALLNKKSKLSDYPIVDMIYGTQKVFNQQTNSMVELYYYNGGKVILSAANAGGPSIGGIVTGIVTNKDYKTIQGCGLTFNIYREMNPQSYSIPAPCVLQPDKDAFAILTYSDNTFSAIAQPQRFVRLGFPLESMTDRQKMNDLYKAFLTFLE